ncbi:hypothetical protein AK830_g1242 [Neonectria ditissima]|uniref:RRM domain-containing protein n=1 Tax=Neonectria ditissima TaxID=78410 RepID=A0A0P7B6H3_9HYPO|nr:hypothetical protein AK830_g1242 [Neonectria ditissima]
MALSHQPHGASSTANKYAPNPSSSSFDDVDHDRSDIDLEAFSYSLRFDALQDAFERRRTNVKDLFKRAAAKIEDKYSVAYDDEAARLRLRIKALLASQQFSVADIRNNRASNMQSPWECDSTDPAALNLRDYLADRVKQAWDTDDQLIDMISEYESLEDMDFVNFDELNEDDLTPTLSQFADSPETKAIFEDDAELVHWPAEAPPFDEASGEMEPSTVHSRRVVMNNLPDGISPAQVIKGVSGLGGLLRIDVINSAKVASGKASALLEFNWASTAEEYAKYIQRKPMYYLDVNGVKHQAEVSVIPTRSYPVDTSLAPLRASGADTPNGRCLEFTEFPELGVWFFFERIGTSNIIGASYTSTSDPFEDGVLTVEFISVFHANQARRLVNHHQLDFYPPSPQHRIVPTFCDSDYKTSDLWGVTNKHTIQYRPIDHLALEWDQRPWNKKWPATIVRPSFSIPRKPVPTTKAYANNTDESLKFETKTSQPSDGSTRIFQGFRFTIVGNTMRIALQNHTWVIATDDQIQPLMQKTLHVPGWASFWDLWFQNTGQINLRKWDEYARIARHRRQQAAAQGLQD